MPKIQLAGRAATKSEMIRVIQNQRETIDALKASLTRRRNPEGNVLTRATVEELMIELEQRPREEVEAYIERNEPDEPSGIIVLPPGARVQ